MYMPSYQTLDPLTRLNLSFLRVDRGWRRRRVQSDSGLGSTSVWRPRKDTTGAQTNTLSGQWLFLPSKWSLFSGRWASHFSRGLRWQEEPHVPVYSLKNRPSPREFQVRHDHNRGISQCKFRIRLMRIIFFVQNYATPDKSILPGEIIIIS